MTTQSIEEVVAEYTPRLRSYIYGMVHDRDDTEDLLQEVFYQLLCHSGSDATAIEKMSAWLYRVAHNTVLNLFRSRRETPFSLYDSDDDSDFACEELSDILFSSENPAPDRVILRGLVWEELDKALDSLPPEQKEVFCLTVFDNIPVKEISRATGVPIATLLSRKHYAVVALRHHLKHLYDEMMEG